MSTIDQFKQTILTTLKSPSVDFTTLTEKLESAFVNLVDWIVDLEGQIKQLQSDKSSKTDTKSVQQFKKVQSECLELFTQKNHDYGDVFRENGPVGVVIRIGDKINRMKTVTNNGISLVDDETLRDTLKDLSNYALMALLLLDEK